MIQKAHVVLLGRFPPPFDGQTLATRRLGELLDVSFDVRRIDIQPRRESARMDHGLSPGRLVHYATLRGKLAKALPDDPCNIIIWPAISPDLAGHLRDRFAVVPALRRFEKIFAVVHRGNFDKLFGSRFTRDSARRLVGQVDGFIFLTEGLSQRCEAWISDEKRFVIPNTIDDDLVFSDDEIAAKHRGHSTARSGAAHGKRSVRLLYLSNMIPSKGYLDVVEAARLLRDRGAEIELRLVGSWKDDHDRLQLGDRIREARLENIARHLGPVEDRGRVKELYGASDVLILPSYYPNEAQPLVIIEALNAGVPVVTTLHGGIPEMITHGREGHLIPPKQPSAIADSVQEIVVGDNWLKFSRAARRRFEQVYSPDRVRRQWEALLRDGVTSALRTTLNESRL